MAKFGSSINRQNKKQRISKIIDLINELQKINNEFKESGHYNNGKLDTKDLLERLKNKSWLEDWDCISCLKLSKINKIFKEQYEKEKNLPIDSHQRTMPFKLPVPTASFPDFFNKGKYNHTKMEIYLGPVNIVFDEKVPNRMKIEYDIVNGPDGQSYFAGWQNEKKNDDIEPTDSKNYIEHNSAKIIGENVALENIAGLVKTSEGKKFKTQKVILSFESAAFKLFQIKFSKDPQVIGRIETSINDYFTNRETPIEYSLGEVVYRNDNTINALEPESFSFYTNKYAFMIHIITKTDASKKNNPQIMPKNIEEHYGYYLLPSDREAALYVNSRIIFDEIIAKNITGGIKARGIRNAFDPKNGIWMLEIDEDWTFSSDTVTVRSGHEIYKNYPHQNDIDVKVEHHTNNISIKKGSKFRAESDLTTLNFDIKENWDQTFVCEEINTVVNPDENETGFVYRPLHAIAKLSLDYNFTVGPLSIDPKTQIIEFPYKSQVQKIVSISAKDSAQKDFLDKLLSFLKKSSLEEIERKISDDLTKKTLEIKMKLNHINVFAASNILFPGRQIIKYDINSVFIPGDMAVFGNLKESLYE
ncbi:378_t:CDS:2 [Cetraspora pellucida]|uniref:378_t:CDS:1 n=1 Tax=Cetraspora pellucida TaxID=1433469 RepID=A0A9N9BLY0_9GLOM|nr:378_t:CDS:2 [Cetraspora pellucida]